MPDYPVDEQHGGEKFETSSSWEKLVADYAHMAIADVDELNFIEFLALRRDAFIERCRATEKGREWLDNAWRIEQTDMDVERMREVFGHHEKQ